MRRLAVILALEVAVAGGWALSPLLSSCGSGQESRRPARADASLVVTQPYRPER